MNTDRGEAERPFEVEELAKGVFAVLAHSPSPALSNAGIVDLGDRTLVFDTLGTAVGGEALRQAAEELTGRAPSIVVNSHSHYDHWCGNQAFAAGPWIVAATEARQKMRELEPSLRATIDDPTPLAERLRALRERLDEEQDARWRTTLEQAIPRLEQQLAALLTLEPILPQVAFQSELALSGPARTVVLRNRGPGHSESDSYLLLPDEHIVFAGDLAFAEAQPVLAGGDPAAWSAALDELAESDCERYVPGHGPVGGKTDLSLQQDYWQAVEALVGKVIARRGTLQEALDQTLPAPFDGWMAMDMIRFELNVMAAFQRLVPPLREEPGPASAGRS